MSFEAFSERPAAICSPPHRLSYSFLFERRAALAEFSTFVRTQERQASSDQSEGFPARCSHHADDTCVAADTGPSLLIRPDACIAWAGEVNSTDGLEEALHRWTKTE
jgi:hypothetical protein